MHISLDMPLPSSTILDSDLWRLLFTLLVRKSSLTVLESSRILAIDTAVTIEPKSLSYDQRLVEQHKQELNRFETFNSTQSSLVHAKQLPINRSLLFESFVTDIATQTSYTAQNHQVLDILLARARSNERHMIDLLERDNVYIQAEIYSNNIHAAKMSDLTFLLGQVDVLATKGFELQTTSTRASEELLLTIKSEHTTLNAYLETIDATGDR
jgi:hypothetical protein